MYGLSQHRTKGSIIIKQAKEVYQQARLFQKFTDASVRLVKIKNIDNVALYLSIHDPY